MTTACDRCAKAIKRTDDVITCMGFCEHVVHLKCASIDKNVVKSVSDIPNYHWMCDECSKLMKVIRFRNAMSSVGNAICELTKNQEAANAELKSELAKHTEQIAQLSNRINSVTPILPVTAPRRTMKRRRIDDNHEARPAKPLIVGTRSTDHTSAVATVPVPTVMFWIYLSRLHPSVKPDAVEKLTRDSLQCDTAKAIPLIKQGTDVNSLNFISFKVGIDPIFREAALDPSSWPKGILFREFEDTRVGKYWMPDACTPSITVTPDPGESSQFASASIEPVEC